MGEGAEKYQKHQYCSGRIHHWCLTPMSIRWAGFTIGAEHRWGQRLCLMMGLAISVENRW